MGLGTLRGSNHVSPSNKAGRQYLASPQTPQGGSGHVLTRGRGVVRGGKSRREGGGRRHPLIWKRRGTREAPWCLAICWKKENDPRGVLTRGKGPRASDQRGTDACSRAKRGKKKISDWERSFSGEQPTRRRKKQFPYTSVQNKSKVEGVSKPFNITLQGVFNEKGGIAANSRQRYRGNKGKGCGRCSTNPES